MTSRRLTLPLAAVGVVLVAVAGLCLGTQFVAPDVVWTSLFRPGTGADDFVVRELRLPRVVGGLAAGALLAWSGLLFQGLFRNPLVSPDFLGIESGASAGVVLGVVLGWSSTWTGALALGGAALSALVIGAIGARGGASGQRLVLVGLGMNALLGAVVTFLLLRANVYQAAKAYQWMVGSLYSTTPDEAVFLAAAVVVLGLPALALVPGVRLLQVGDQGAISLGAPVGPWKLGVALLACAMAAAAVSVVGPIGFVALAVPHAARLLVGPVSVPTFAASGLLGAVLLLGVDVLGQNALPGHLPAGLLAAALGGPYFLYLLRRRRPVL